MHKFISAIALSVIGTIVVGGSAQAQSSISLNRIAARNSYTLQWLYPERSIQLYRPGLVIVIRPGERAYDVNNRVEFSDAAPTYVNGDLLISPALASRLQRLASIAVTHVAASGARPAAEQLQPASGPITVDVRHAQGSEALNVSGHAPPGSPITITLLATISPDLPTVVVSRHDVQPDASGQFSAVISNAPDYLRGTLLQVVATSAGASPASATVTVGPPNPGVTVPFDKPYCPNTDPFCSHFE